MTNGKTGGTGASYASHEAELRRRWGELRGEPSYDEIEPAFLFGWAAAHDVGLAGHPWVEVEADLAGHWFDPDSAEEVMAWDQIRDAVKLAFELGGGPAGGS